MRSIGSCIDDGEALPDQSSREFFDAVVLHNELILKGVLEHPLLHVEDYSPHTLLHLDWLQALQTHLLQLLQVKLVRLLFFLLVVLAKHLEEALHAAVEPLDEAAAAVIHLAVVGHHAGVLVEAVDQPGVAGPLAIAGEKAPEEGLGEDLERLGVEFELLDALLLPVLHLPFFVDGNPAHARLQEGRGGLAPIDGVVRARAVGVAAGAGVAALVRPAAVGVGPGAAALARLGVAPAAALAVAVGVAVAPPPPPSVVLADGLGAAVGADAAGLGLLDVGQAVLLRVGPVEARLPVARGHDLAPRRHQALEVLQRGRPRLPRVRRQLSRRGPRGEGPLLLNAVAAAAVAVVDVGRRHLHRRDAAAPRPRPRRQAGVAKAPLPLGRPHRRLVVAVVVRGHGERSLVVLQRPRLRSPVVARSEQERHGVVVVVVVVVRLALASLPAPLTSSLLAAEVSSAVTRVARLPSRALRVKTAAVGRG